VKARCCLASVAALALPLLLSGCMWTTRKLPIPKAPSVVQTVSADELVNRLNKRWDALDSLYAKVEIQASVLKTKEGTAKDYTTIGGIIMIRKPELLRVYGRAPVIGTRIFDLTSDGADFTLFVPSGSKAVKGSNSLRKKSANPLENMRPGFFLDAMIVRGLEPRDEYMVTADTIMVEDAARKRLYSVPEYKLSIMRSKADSHELEPKRVVYFHRDDLLPYQQDIYDSEGNLETEVKYAQYADFGGALYPSSVTIKRPLEEYQIVLTVDTVKENMTLKDDQFQITLPEGTQIQKLE
jgi:outer membrane lipoprotein-sorting protein